MGAHLTVHDRLVAFDVRDSDRTNVQNVGENIHQGLEVALRWQPRPWGSVHASYTGHRSVFQGPDLDGNHVAGVPEQRFFVEATDRLRPVWICPAVDAADEYCADNANTAAAESYTLVDVGPGLRDLGLESVDIRPYAEVSDVFDTSYTGSVSINAKDNYSEPGTGRAYKIGVTIRL